MSELVTLRRAPAPSGNVSAAAAARPAAHRRIETLVMGVFWLLVLEGSLRKWVLPQFAHYLFFIRDPLVLLIYYHALRAGLFRGSNGFLQAGLAFAAVALPLALVQIASLGSAQALTVVAYGWRQYFLYLPLPFIMARTFTRESLTRFLRHAALALIINAPLEFLQFHASPAAVINRGIAEDESLQFKSFSYIGGLIRPSGTFTSSVGVKELVASGFALLLAAWLTPAASRRVGKSFLLVATAAAAAALALSGSRGAFVHCVIVLLSALAVGFISRCASIRGRALTLPLALVGAVIVLYPIVFPDALAAFVSRSRAAYASESQFSSLGIVGRALYETVDFVNFLGAAPLAGYGLGLGGNGRTFFQSDDPEFLGRIAAESDWSRHIVDLGPVVGLLFIAYRIAFTLWLLAQALRATRLSASPRPLVLFGYVGVGLFYGQLTGHGTVGGFLWLYLGLCLAACAQAVASGPVRPPARVRNLLE
jgi:hypothetical protein